MSPRLAAVLVGAPAWAWAALLIAVAAPGASAQTDPLVLQQQAVQRLDDVVAHFRRTGEFATRRAEMAQAEAELAQSNRLLAQRGDLPALALGQIKQGTAWRLQGEWQRAVALYRQAAQTAQRAGDAGREADAMSWKALAESSQNHLGQALADAKAALRRAELANQPDVLALALDVLGGVQTSLGDLPAAADTYEREVAVAAKVRDPMARYFAFLGRSDVYLKTGTKCDFQRSFEPCFKALDLAEADMRQAQDIVNRLGHTGLMQQTQGMLNGIQARRQLVQLQQSNDSSVGSASMFNPRKASDVLVTENFANPSGDMPPGFDTLLQSLRQQHKQVGAFAQSSEADMANIEGQFSTMSGQSEAALAWYRQSIAALERDRRSLRDERSRSSYMNDRIGIYYRCALLLLQQQRVAEAFEVFERSRSRALADLLASRPLDVGAGAERALYAEASTLRARIADAQGKAFEASAQPDTPQRTELGAALDRRIAADEARYQQVLERMAAQAPRLHQLVEAKPASLAALQASMRAEGYETLQYMVTESALILWHITPDSVFVRNVFLPRSVLMRKVASLAASLRSADQAFDETSANELFLYLVQPALARLRAQHLVVIPHEDLAALPFQVLRNPANGRYFGERFRLTYAPSATVLLGLRRSTPLAGARVVAMADPSIRGAAQEVQAMGRLFPGRSRVQAEALPRESEVKSLPPDLDVLHLAVHGSFDAGEPMLSHLKLAAGGGEDGRLTAAEMFGLPLAKSRLVVLSACETGKAETTHGNETLGMARALLYAGANALLLSQWQVSSEATTQWMQTFYEAATTRPPAEAARLAAQQLRNQPATSHPFYWAPFTLTAR